jgi:hypothetical protein
MGRKKKEIKSEESKKDIAEENLTSFDLVSAELEKMHGKGIFAKEKNEYNWLKTGSLTLDAALDPASRGLRSAISISFSSEPKVGKSRTLMYLAGKAQRDNFVDFVLYCDVECRNSLETCKTLGIDTSPQKFKMYQMSTAEEYIDMIDRYLSTGKRLFIILDSMDALQSGKIKSLGWLDEKDMKSRNTAGLRRAGLVTEFINATNSKVRKTNSVFAYTQQLRTKMGPSFSYRQESGCSAGFYNVDYHVRLSLEKHSEIVFNSKNENGISVSQTYGRMVNFEFILNAFNAPGIEEKIAILYERGLWEEYDLANLGVKFGFIAQEKKKTKDDEDIGGKVTYKSDAGKEIEKKNVQSFAAFLTNRDKLPEITEIKKELRKKVIDALEQKRLIKAF